MKTRWSLVPPDILKDIADVFTAGAPGHGDFAWQGKTAEEHYDAAQRHLIERAMGKKIDKDTKKAPIYNAIARLMMVAWIDKHGEAR